MCSRDRMKVPLAYSLFSIKWRKVWIVCGMIFRGASCMRTDSVAGEDSKPRVNLTWCGPGPYL